MSSNLELERMIADYVVPETNNPLLIEAFRKVPRMTFVPYKFRFDAYRNEIIPTGRASSLSEVRLVAQMLDAVNLDGTGRVMEVGSGTGYVLSLLSRCAEMAFGLEYDDELTTKSRGLIAKLGIQNAYVCQRDGALGFSEFAPYKAIVVSAAAREIPQTLVDQLDEGGKIVIPVNKTSWRADLVVGTKTNTKFATTPLFEVNFYHLMSSSQGGWTDASLEEARNAEEKEEAKDRLELMIKAMRGYGDIDLPALDW